MVRRKVTQSQLALLLDLLESDRDLAVGRLSAMPLGHADIRSRWVGVADTLNAFGDGATKTGPEWKTYWHELKYKTRKRAMELRLHARGTGGGPGKKPLSELELRIIGLIGELSVYGHAEVQVPFDDPLQPAAASAASPTPTASAASPVPSIVSPPLAPVLVRQHAPILITNTNTVRVPARVPVAAPVDPLLLSDESDNPAMAGPSGNTRTTNRPGPRRRHDRRTESRRSYIQRVSAGPPQWAQEFEERRLEIDARTAQAFEGISAALGGIREILADVVNLMRSIDQRLNE